MKKITDFFLIFLPLLILAQHDTKIVFYKHNLQLYNPAATGLENQTVLSSTLRSQWSGIQGAPDVQVFNLSIPEGEKRLGYGTSLMLDQTFIERKTSVFASFSYRLPLGDRYSLYLGIQGGGNHINLNFNDLNLADEDDGALENLTRFYPNIGIGTYFKTDQLYISLSSPMLFAHKKDKNADAISPTPDDDLHFYFSTGLHFPLFASDWKLITSSLIRWIPNAPSSLIINTGFAYLKSELLFVYHRNNGFGSSAFFDNGGPISVGYAFQFSGPSSLSQIHSGNHELILRIRFNNKKINSKALDKHRESEDDLSMYYYH